MDDLHVLEEQTFVRISDKKAFEEMIDFFDVLQEIDISSFYPEENTNTSLRQDCVRQPLSQEEMQALIPVFKENGIELPCIFQSREEK